MLDLCHAAKVANRLADTIAKGFGFGDNWQTPSGQKMPRCRHLFHVTIWNFDLNQWEQKCCQFLSYFTVDLYKFKFHNANHNAKSDDLITHAEIKPAGASLLTA